MKHILQKVARILGIGVSALLLIASVGIIFWISQDEQDRLALKEKAGFVKSIDPAVEAEKLAQEKTTANLEAADKALHEIETILASLANDDLPTEE